jgi:polysaccharide deacetylase 2 family uncharacterized protein YibQ
LTRRARSRDKGLWPLLALAAFLAVALLILERFDTPPPEEPPGSARDADPGRRAGEPPEDQGIPRSGRGLETPEDPDWVPADGSIAFVAIVIDDVGFDERPALELSKLDLPLTFAILPYQRHSRSLSSRLREAGHEVILHLPMEPEQYPLRDPGKGVVGGGMDAGEIVREMASALQEVPQAAGISNHMGSRATADSEVMRVILEEVRSRGLYFLDSRTTTSTVALQMAQEMRVPALERSVFLDASRDESYIESQVRRLLREARDRGSAVAIGHLYPATVEVLKRSAGLLQGEDIRLVPASELAGFERGGSG